MNFVTPLVVLTFLAAAPARSAEETSYGVPARLAGAAQPVQYSFSDLYRLAVAGQGAGMPAVSGAATVALVPVTAADAPARSAAALSPAQFTVSETPEPQLGALLLAGIAAAVWVARRRLGYAL